MNFFQQEPECVHVDVLRFYWAHEMCSKEVAETLNEKAPRHCGEEKFFVKASLARFFLNFIFDSAHRNERKRNSSWEVPCEKFKVMPRLALRE